MFIATDGTGPDIPDDVRQAAEAFSSELGPLPQAGKTDGPDMGDRFGAPAPEGGVAPPPLVTKGSALDRWDIQAHQYKTAAEVKMGILGGLFSSRSKLVKSGVVQEAKRYKVTQTDKDNRIEFGTAVRLVVAINETEADLELTIPNIAAGAQLAHFEARIALSVVGFVGPLGDMLPAPGELNVETLPDYLDAFRKMQSYIFGREGAPFLAPTLLGYSKLEQ